MMKKILQGGGVTIALIILLMTSGCTGALIETVAKVIPEEKQNKEPLRKLNPNPQHAYQVKVSLKNPPGDFQQITGGVGFDVENPACGKHHPISGIVPSISSYESIVLSKVSEYEYTGVFYSDMILDGDYYGRGVCKWKLSSVSARFSNKVDTLTSGYSIFLIENSIQNQNTNTRYYWNGYYRPADLPSFIDSGHKDLAQVPENRKNEFFSITISAKKLN